jgi:hypothetical protein
MLIECYRSYMMPYQEQDPLSIFVQAKGGWMSVGPISVDYYIPHDYAYMMYMYDSAIKRLPKLDYIV